MFEPWFFAYGSIVFDSDIFLFDLRQRCYVCPKSHLQALKFGLSVHGTHPLLAEPILCTLNPVVACLMFHLARKHHLMRNGL